MSETLTVCSFCGCGCGLCIITSRETVINIIPSLSNPVNRGSLCMKGWHIDEVYTGNDRLTKPLIKVNGEFRESSFEEAYDTISKKFKSFKDKEKSIGIIGSAKITGEESYLLNRFARQVLGTNNIGSSFTLHYSPVIKNINRIDLSIGMEDIENSDCVIIIGSNLHTEAPQVIKKVLKAGDRGAKIIVINYLPVPLSNVADIPVQINPDEYITFINYLKTRDWKDNRIGKLAQEITDIYDRAKNPLVICGEDIFKGMNAENDFSILLDLFKNRVFPLFTVNNILGALSYGVSPYIDNRYLEKKWDTKLPKSKGLNVVEMIKAADEGTLKCLYVVGEDIMLSMGDYNNTRKALEKLDFLVVQDLYLTETARMADVVLPACSSLEKKGSFMNMEGKSQSFTEAIKPVGESSPDWRIFLELSEKFDFKLPYKKIEEVTEEIKDFNCLKNKKNLKGDVGFPPENTGKDFPLWIKADNPRLMYHSGSLLKNSYILSREMEPGLVMVHPDNAKDLQMKNNERIKIITKQGWVEKNILISNDVPKGIAVVRTIPGDSSHSVILPVGLKWAAGRLEKII